jgi:hypothetical protein
MARVPNEWCDTHATRPSMTSPGPPPLAPPVAPGPARRPRWCPAHAPAPAQDGGLPRPGDRRRSPPVRREEEPTVHDATHHGARSRGLPPRVRPLRSLITGRARATRSDRLARRSSGGTCAGGAHPLGTITPFPVLARKAKTSASSWRDQALVRRRMMHRSSRDT